MSELYKHGRINSADLKRFLDRKVKIALQNKYVECFNAAFPEGSASIYDFEKWAKNLRFHRNDYVTPNDAQTVLDIINKA